MPTIIRLSCVVYGGMLICYPRELRNRFGAEMVEDFGDLLRDAAAHRGLAGMLSLWGSVIWELVTVAVPQRLRETTVIACALSFVLSSALFLAFFRVVN